MLSKEERWTNLEIMSMGLLASVRDRDVDNARRIITNIQEKLFGMYVQTLDRPVWVCDNMWVSLRYKYGGVVGSVISKGRVPDTTTSLILAHASNGVDIFSPQYHGALLNALGGTTNNEDSA